MIFVLLEHRANEDEIHRPDHHEQRHERAAAKSIENACGLSRFGLGQGECHSDLVQKMHAYLEAGWGSMALEAVSR